MLSSVVLGADFYDQGSILVSIGFPGAPFGTSGDLRDLILSCPDEAYHWRFYDTPVLGIVLRIILVVFGFFFVEPHEKTVSF